MGPLWTPDSPGRALASDVREKNRPSSPNTTSFEPVLGEPAT